MAPREPSSRRRERERERERESERPRDQRKRRSQAVEDDGQPRRSRHHKRHQSREDSDNTAERSHQAEKRRSSHRPATLSADALAKIEQENRRNARREERAERATRPHRDEYREVYVEKQPAVRRAKKNKRRRHASGAILEEGRGWAELRGGASAGDDGTENELLYHGGKKPPFWKRKKRLLICISIFIALLILTIALAVVFSKNNKKSEASNGPSTSNLGGKDRNSVPQEYQGTDLDPWSWLDTSGFNVTFTSETVGDLPVMGLFTEWDDSKAPNDKVPALNKPWGSYGDRPARGVNIGGWLSLEPFITPSLFSYDSKLGIVDEYTLCTYLGQRAPEVLERHYANFVTEQTFKDIADAGIDHVRIPFSYWALEVYDGDPYVYRTSWRYLLRGIEWARKYGLRINLDPHGIPGSQNGWNHSGRLGMLNWLAGSDGDTNKDRSLDMHDRLSKFFAQDRYRNIIAFYGLANEPKMTALPVSAVISWTEDAFNLVRKNGLEAVVVFGDGFMGLGNWQGKLTGLSNLALDVHQYVIFNANQIVFTHKEKLQYACDGWTKQAVESMDTSTGFGPTIFAEWSQADTDCAQHLTNVGWGSRWEGTFDTGSDKDSVLTPRCPAKDSSCSCTDANADPSTYSSPYRKFLKMFAEAQMHSFEKGWGWWYWTWQTENAPQWSYKAGLEAGILPKKAYERDFDCSGEIPDFEDLPETY